MMQKYYIKDKARAIQALETVIERVKGMPDPSDAP